MNDLFESYEIDYLQLIHSIKFKLNSSTSNQLQQTINHELEEADEIVSSVLSSVIHHHPTDAIHDNHKLSQIEIELNTLDHNHKDRLTFQSKLKSFKSQLINTKSHLVKSSFPFPFNHYNKRY
jgi:hypothetical protein